MNDMTTKLRLEELDWNKGVEIDYKGGKRSIDLSDQMTYYNTQWGKMVLKSIMEVVFNISLLNAFNFYRDVTYNHMIINKFN